MHSDKPRIYVILHARGGDAKMPGREDMYHWSLLMGPKVEEEGARGKRYHAKEVLRDGIMDWSFEERETTLMTTGMLLVRILIGKVENVGRLVELLRTTPIRPDQPGWNCVMWVREALERLEDDGKALGTRVTAWNRIRDAAMGYCQTKKDQHHFDGKGNSDMGKPATYDLLAGKETIP